MRSLLPVALNSSTFKHQEAFEFRNPETASLLRGTGKRKEIPRSRFQEAGDPGRSAPAAACNSCSLCLQREMQSPVLQEDFRAKGRVFVTERPVKVLSLTAGILGPLVCLEIFPLLSLRCSRRRRLQLRRRLFGSGPAGLGS